VRLVGKLSQTPLLKNAIGIRRRAGRLRMSSCSACGFQTGVFSRRRWPFCGRAPASENCGLFGPGILRGVCSAAHPDKGASSHRNSRLRCAFRQPAMPISKQSLRALTSLASHIARSQ
jgi:hypothetical protein